MTSRNLSIRHAGRFKNPIYEFHIARQIRKKYNLEDYLFTISGNVIFANFTQVRNFVYKLNQNRPDNLKVGAGEVNAAGLLDEIYHFVLREYEEKFNPGVWDRAVKYLNVSVGDELLRKLLFDFVEVFPPFDVYKGQSSSFDYLNSYTGSRSNYSIALEEMLTLYFSNFNPANKRIIELFDSNYLNNSRAFEKVINHLDFFFQGEEKIGEDKQDLFTFLMIPILKHPESIEAQLDFIKSKWGVILDEKYLQKILSGKDLIKEDYKIEFHGGGAPPTFVPQYKEAIEYAQDAALGKSGFKYGAESVKSYEEPEKFTEDLEWMPRLVLLAKNVYVWLDQLSKKYSKNIRRLDEIPDEELDQLADWHFTGLWLIGIWERSSASKKIKHQTGNIDAVASAYSLFDYQIAYDLGGEDAYRNLDWRTKQRGIRLACDMVPNHTGIYSKWMIEHPEYFIQSEYPPFPNYRFTGPNLSDDPRIQLRIEDGYWSKSDAAVVFQRIENSTGKVSYFYHGNDGTNMPWNDTSQLDLLKPEVRDALIEKIVDVARRFSVIRFDAAMTLTKRHYSRLWYPEPGKGGDIPSRSDYALTPDQFDKRYPEEFWRLVVDRINNELPNTLLLAEAFWLMEGYFVRTLGMHRVYNSAFMNMLLKEENFKYRDLITNTLEFEPEILKRYVNFMSNPDEETAIKQFGADEKYFGICVLMVTLPGLPMFGHGQVEGFHEKYGMEYQRSYYNEEPNQWLIDRHKKEIFPLLKRRSLFSQVGNFWFYDFINNYGHIDENVFAYTNTEHGEKALVFYNNKYSHVSGGIDVSTPKLVQSDTNGKKEMKTLRLFEALGIKPQEDIFYVFKEHKSGLQFIKQGKEFAAEGFKVNLKEFEYKIYLDFIEVPERKGECRKLAGKLAGQGTGNIFYSLEEIHFEDFHGKLEDLFDRESLDKFIKYSIELDSPATELELSFMTARLNDMFTSLKGHYDIDINIPLLIETFENELELIKKINELIKERTAKKEHYYFQIKNAVVYSQHHDYYEHTAVFLIWYLINNLAEITRSRHTPRSFIDDTYLYNPIRNVLRRFGKGETAVEKDLNLLLVLSENYRNFVASADDEKKPLQFNKFFAGLFESPLAEAYLNINDYKGAKYFSKESFEEIVDWFFSIAIFELLKLKPSEEKLEKTENKILEMFKLCDEIKSMAVKCGYKLDIFLSLLES